MQPSVPAEKPLKVGQPRIGIVLSSGGTRGLFAHTGFLSGLDELGIDYEAVAGCSAGAVVGGVVASGTSIAQWSDALATATATDFWDPDPIWRMLWRFGARRGRAYTGLSDTRRPIELCRTLLAVDRFEDCPRRFRALAVSLSQNRKVVFSRGDLAPRMVASAAAPVLYRPVEIDGDFYCDGAIVEFGPVDAICCDHDLDLVIVHHVAVHREGVAQLRTALRGTWALGRIVDWIVYREHPWYLTGDPLSVHRCPGECGTKIVVLEPALPEMPWGTIRCGSEIQSAARQQTLELIGARRTELLSLDGAAPPDH